MLKWLVRIVVGFVAIIALLLATPLELGAEQLLASLAK
jgi:hypothetical protein